MRVSTSKRAAQWSESARGERNAPAMHRIGKHRQERAGAIGRGGLAFGEHGEDETVCVGYAARDVLHHLSGECRLVRCACIYLATEDQTRHEGQRPDVFAFIPGRRFNRTVKACEQQIRWCLFGIEQQVSIDIAPRPSIEARVRGFQGRGGRYADRDRQAERMQRLCGSALPIHLYRFH